MEVKNFEALGDAIVAADPERIPIKVGDESDGWVEVAYGDLNLVIGENGHIDVMENNTGQPSSISPEMYPVVKAAIAEIERQNA